MTELSSNLLINDELSVITGVDSFAALTVCEPSRPGNGHRARWPRTSETPGLSLDNYRAIGRKRGDCGL